MELRKIDRTNLWAITKLTVAPAQQDFVATNTQSILEAYITKEAGYVALPFGLYHEGVPVGFTLIGYGTAGDEDEPAIAEGNYCLWRLMIAQEFQGRGFGTQALQAILSYVKTFPCGMATHCWLSYERENSIAKALYAASGFVETGELCDGEIVAVKPL